MIKGVKMHYLEEYYSNHDKNEEEYEREKNACCDLYNDSLKQQLKEAKNMLFKCLDTLNKFLARTSIGVETFADYVECSTYDKHFLCKVEQIKIAESTSIHLSPNL